VKNTNSACLKRSSGKTEPLNCTAFEGQRCIASGRLTEVARKIKTAADRGNVEPILVFDDLTSELVEIDLRGTVDQVVNRLGSSDTAGATVVEAPPKRGPGRPKLGVIPREVTLLPGQWDWLDEQSGGASAALRRLIYEARRANQGKDRARQSQEAVYRFMTTMAGDLPGFEEALRAFYRRDHQRFDSLVANWPKDIHAHVRKLVAVAHRDPAAAPESALH
jgi:uncharacterized protein